MTKMGLVWALNMSTSEQEHTTSVQQNKMCDTPPVIDILPRAASGWDDKNDAPVDIFHALRSSVCFIAAGRLIKDPAEL